MQSRKNASAMRGATRPISLRLAPCHESRTTATSAVAVGYILDRPSTALRWGEAVTIIGMVPAKTFLSCGSGRNPDGQTAPAGSVARPSSGRAIARDPSPKGEGAAPKRDKKNSALSTRREAMLLDCWGGRRTPDSWSGSAGTSPSESCHKRSAHRE